MHVVFLLHELSTKDEDAQRSLLGNVARCLIRGGDYMGARIMFRRQLELCKKGLGEEHLVTLVSMNNLALLLNSQGRSDEVEAMQLRVLELRKTVLGEEYLGALVSMNNLAMVLSDQGKYNDVEAMHCRVLEM
jgi:hypothetical protein